MRNYYLRCIGVLTDETGYTYTESVVEVACYYPNYSSVRQAFQDLAYNSGLGKIELVGWEDLGEVFRLRRNRFYQVWCLQF